VVVIVLDGSQRSTLAVVRSLGKKGVSVVVGAEVPRSVSAVSRYCEQSFVYPSPYSAPEEFMKVVLDRAKEFSGAMLLPMTDVTLSEILKGRDELSKFVRIPFPSWEVYREISDKVAMFRTASKLGVPIPKTYFSEDFSSFSEMIPEGSKMGFPLVLKPGLSRIKREGKWSNTSVCYAGNSQDFERLVEEEPFRDHPFLVQEKIEGPGIGIFLLMKDGRLLARFAHKRLREKPPSGGVSVLCESIAPPEEALDAARKVLEHYGWSGVAMVEFKRDSRDGRPKLMEINARFWGSLQLAVSSGVDFPYLLYASVNGGEIATQSNYKYGVKSRWELGDFDHLLIRFLRRNSDLRLPREAPPRRKLLASFISDFFRPSVRHEVFRPDDPRPLISEMRQYIRSLII
jgi:predicted ATP-grasp superfamily ATP-dependent carboligase